MRKHKVKSYLGALLLLVILSVWMLTGILSDKSDTPSVEKQKAAAEKFTVRYRPMQAVEIDKTLTAYGDTRPEKAVTLRAETASCVTKNLAQLGGFFSKNESMLMLDKEERPQRVRQARAFLKLKEQEHSVAEELAEKGHKPKNYLLTTSAALEQARTELRLAQMDLSYTDIKAPFDGLVTEIMVEEGDFVNVGDPLFAFVDSDPLKVVGFFSQTEINKLKTGQLARIHLATGEDVEGVITAFSPQANAATRTFAVEMEVPNTDYKLLSGVSADIRLPVEKRQAHFFSPQYLCLEEDDSLGVRCLDDNDTVVFYPIEIIQAEKNGIYAGGLPDNIRLITVGHLFVQDGDVVQAVEEE